jgi:ATP-dependent DNA ligase
VRSPTWLKVKPKLQLEVLVTGGSAERITWGDWGAAVMLELAYRHPRTGSRHQIRQAVGVAQGNFKALFEAIEREQDRRGTL